MKVNKWFKINTLGFVQSINWFFLLLCSFTISACNSVDDPTPESPKPQGSQAETVMNELWKTSCLLPDKSARIANYNTIQSWADICPSDNVFLKYIKADEVTAVTSSALIYFRNTLKRMKLQLLHWQIHILL